MGAYTTNTEEDESKRMVATTDEEWNRTKETRAGDGDRGEGWGWGDRVQQTRGDKSRDMKATHIHTYTHTHVHTCTHIHIHTYTHSHVHTCTRTHIHMFTHVHTYTHTITTPHEPRPWIRKPPSFFTECVINTLRPVENPSQQQRTQRSWPTGGAAVRTRHVPCWPWRSSGDPPWPRPCCTCSRHVYHAHNHASCLTHSPETNSDSAQQQVVLRPKEQPRE